MGLVMGLKWVVEFVLMVKMPPFLLCFSSVFSGFCSGLLLCFLERNLWGL